MKPLSVYNSPQIYKNSCRFFKHLQVFTRNLDKKPEIKNTCRFFKYLQVSVCFLIPQFKNLAQEISLSFLLVLTFLILKLLILKLLDWFILVTNLHANVLFFVANSARKEGLYLKKQNCQLIDNQQFYSKSLPLSGALANW